jgi:K+-sensing histidine kinase KdpD
MVHTPRVTLQGREKERGTRMKDERRGGRNYRWESNVGFRTTVASSYSFIQEFYQEHVGLLIFLIALTVLSAFVGVVWPGPIGVFVSLILNVFIFFLPPYAYTKVREIHKSGGD